MTLSAKLARTAKFGLIAALLTVVSMMLAVPSASAEPAAAAPVAAAPVAVQSVDKSDAGINASYYCTYNYDFNDFRWDCWVYGGWVRSYVRCAPGTTYYTAYYPAGWYFWQQVHCGLWWTAAGIQTVG